MELLLYLCVFSLSCCFSYEQFQNQGWASSSQKGTRSKFQGKKGTRSKFQIPVFEKELGTTAFQVPSSFCIYIFISIDILYLKFHWCITWIKFHWCIRWKIYFRKSNWFGTDATTLNIRFNRFNQIKIINA